MTRVNQNFFERRADYVAQDLLGKSLVVKQEDGTYLEGRLREIAAYEGATKSTSEGARYCAGTVSISVKFGNCLIDIATGGKKRSASCVTIRAIELEVDNEIMTVDGPGRVAEVFGITKDNKHDYEYQTAYGNNIWIKGESIPKKVILSKRGNSLNCLGFYYF